MSPAERLAAVRERIVGACKTTGRDLSEVTLIAVSKTKPWNEVAAFAALGVKDFGENYVQEALAKREAGAADLRWHLIGTQQSNKAKLIAGKFFLFHALDSLSFAEKLNRAAGGHAQDCLLEVNVDQETTKGGVEESLVPNLLEQLSLLENVRIKGLMCIPAPNSGRGPFARLRELRDRMNALGAYREKLQDLSMGMSADFEEAIREGATYVRVGTTLFGERMA
jgi:pyridoxal phosphate enzyme (YggS family)